MKKAKISNSIMVCLLVLCCILAFTGCVQIKSPSEESDRKIEPYRELTDREYSLSERVHDAIMEVNKIHECEVAVMLDLPIHIIVAITLEENEKLSNYSELDSQAVYTAACNAMSSENVIVGTENITISVGELEQTVN